MSINEFESFFGRQDILDLLRKRVVDLKEGYRQNIAFIGDSYLGKSTILKKFISDLDEKNIVPIYLNLENKDIEYFYQRFVGSILYHFSKIKKLPLQQDINLLMESTYSFIPQTIKLIKRIKMLKNHGRQEEAIMDMLSLPLNFGKEADAFVLIVLDEFHHLQDFNMPDIFQELGKRIMTQKRCLYVVTSSQPVVAENILSEKLSLLFGNFEKVKIKPFDLKTSREFIHFILKGIKISDHLSDFLIDFTGGFPLYLQLLCHEIIHLCTHHKQSEVFVPILSQAIEDVLFNHWGVLSRHFDLTLQQLSAGKGNTITSPLLFSLSEGKKKINDLVKEVSVKQNQITQKINRLNELGVVVKNGKFYYIRDKLFKYWLKYVCRKILYAMELDPAKEKNLLQEDIQKAIDNFICTLQKDFSTRIVELLYCFENEAFQINGRRYKLPLFQEVVPKKIRKRTGEYFDVIKASSAEGDWFIVLKKDNIGENDINQFLAEAKKSKQKSQRCVLISLADLDENTRVKALQERMWIWNERELNTLLNLYDKPFITAPNSVTA
ncbi:MAG: hypothetical protein KAR05_06320 [Candidatus Omnitrophica bacterium]|nr:hypothetical protein [Candidatus Omnitrophota bacterium]